MKNILLDLDGVVINFVQAALDAHEATITHADIVQWDMHELMGLTAEAFWERINERSPTFWAEASPYPWGRDLAHTIHATPGVELYFCTSPSTHPQCAAGKVMWLIKNFDHTLNRRYILTPHKHLLANPNTLLIDDSQSNTRRFREAGGHAYTFPQPWNGRGGYTPERRSDELYSALEHFLAQ